MIQNTHPNPDASRRRCYDCAHLKGALTRTRDRAYAQGREHGESVGYQRGECAGRGGTLMRDNRGVGQCVGGRAP